RACVGTTFDDVRRHRHRGTHQLVTKSGTPCSVHSCSCSIRIDCNLLRGLPDAEFSEVSHSESFIASIPALPSLRRLRMHRVASHRDDNYRVYVSSPKMERAVADNGHRASRNGQQATGNGQRAAENG